MDNVHVSKHTLTSLLTYLQIAVAEITEGLQRALLQKGFYAKKQRKVDLLSKRVK